MDPQWTRRDYVTYIGLSGAIAALTVWFARAVDHAPWAAWMTQ